MIENIVYREIGGVRVCCTVGVVGKSITCKVVIYT